MIISVIAAVSENEVIGKDGKIPWRLKSDLLRFKQLTIGHHVIMGRKTFESIGAALQNRKNVVLTSDWDIAYHDAVTTVSLSTALFYAYKNNEVESFIIGGVWPYREGLAIAERLYLTKVHTRVKGGVRFPSVDWNRWKLVKEENHSADEENQYPFTFCVYEKV